ncbi:MAG: nucleotidyltransferase domain-containing protein [Candidatus Omnitrophota bacterium]
MYRSIIEVNRIAHRTTKLLSSYVRLKAGYLFGSYVNGKPHKYSDIDLAFFSPSVNRMGIEEKISLISKVGQQVGSDVEIHLYSDRCLKDARPTNFYGHILKTGRKIL